MPFLTVHQSKGLEFPVVVLASCRHNNRQARPLDVLVHKMFVEQNKLPEMAEPLDKMDEYDTMRMFYVALSRAKNVLIMTINMTEDEIELKLRDFFEEKNRALIERITRSEVKLSLPEQKMKVSKGANRNNMYKYLCARAEDQDDFVNGNLEYLQE